jgi:hypothetical protein
MRIYRIGKQIYVHCVPLDTIWFCPYCCATVDTASVTRRATGSRTYTLLPCFVYWLLRLSAIPQRSVCIGAQLQRVVCATCIVSLAVVAS